MTQNTDISLLGQPLVLPCGAKLKNRIVKSAMSEIMGTPSHAPTPQLEQLYRRWAAGGTGLLMSGNVMIDRRAIGEPANVVVEDERDLPGLQAWAKAGTENNTHFWMQLNHPGKQSPKFLSSETVAPSAVGFGPDLSGMFATPRALTEEEIENIIARFATAADIAKKAGFTGVQLHGAHGYLVSQFLSPHHNQREDQWGGSLENRSRFVLEVYRSIRQAVGDEFPVGIKINSADFQKGGFSEEDSVAVMSALSEAGIDLIEVSGGTYEAPAMSGMKVRKSTQEREGYFLSFVEKARESVTAPLCVTGGFRTAAGMASAVGEGAADLVGLARTLAIQPDFPAQVLAGESPESLVRRLSTGIRSIDKMGMLEVTWYENQLARMGNGKDPSPGMGAWRSMVISMSRMGMQAFRLRRAKG